MRSRAKRILQNHMDSDSSKNEESGPINKEKNH